MLNTRSLVERPPAYCPRDLLLNHGPHLNSSEFCGKCGIELVTEGIKPRSGIESWSGWPSDCVETIRAWNRGRGLRFAINHYFGCRPSIFRCCDCKLLCEAARYGVAVLKGDKICDDCLIGRARA